MGCDTRGKIKGFVHPDEILNFVRQKYDATAKSDVSETVLCPLKKCEWDYTLNPHGHDRNNWTTLTGFIVFSYKDEKRMLFYSYSNINSLENLEFYSERNLEDMVRAETTGLSLGTWGHSVEIIQEIVAQFGGGWVDDNDCDSEEFYPVELNADDSIKPVRYVTMEEVRERFDGDTVIIVSSK